MTDWIAVYKILQEECGAQEYWRENFCLSMAGDCREYRFQGSLGFGGKLYRDSRGLRVDCYPEDDTPARRESIKRANERLKA